MERILRDNITVWIFAARFPSTLQRWLTNIATQIPKHGGDVKIFSMREGEQNFPEYSDEFKLLPHTSLLKVEGLNSLNKIAANFLNPKKLFSSIRGALDTRVLGNANKSKLNNLLSRLVLAPYLVKKEVDIIHSHSEPAGYKLLPIVRAQKVPFVITFHGLPPPGVNELPVRMREEYTQQASVILVNTEFSKKQYTRLGACEEKIRILPQGTNTHKFKFKAKSFPADNIIKVLTVARFHSEKGQEYAIRAIATLIKAGYQIEYTLVGEGPDKSYLQELAEDLEISPFLNFKSSLSEDEIIAEYQAHHVFILPSLGSEDGLHEETQGVVVQEAQACGALVIATETGGISECLQFGRKGFLVQDKSEQAIAEKLQEIIDNPQKWSEWQITARKWVEENYDIDVIGKKMMQLYQELIQQNNNTKQDESKTCLD